MAYEIRKSDGTVLLDLETGFVDAGSSSITFIGKNVSNFGEYQNNNFLHLLENFSANTPPANVITGQLWFDKSSRQLKVYDINSWKTLATVSLAPTSDSAQSAGDLWFNTGTKQLSVNTGDEFTVIGPDDTPGYGTTRLESVVATSTSGTLHPIVKCIVGAEVIYIVSRVEFDLGQSSLIEGFTRVYRGITLKSGNVQMFGRSRIADFADQLKSESGIYVAATSSLTPDSIVQRDGLGNTQLNLLEVSTLNSANGQLTGSWTVSNTFTPTTTNAYSLGTNDLKWLAVNARDINALTGNISTVKFSALIDPSLTGITKFDTDPELTANSHSNLATQRAIKEYIDAAVAREVQSRTAGDANLQTQISNLETVPAGTVFYTAAITQPEGYLIANGSWVPKSSYPRLFQAIGGTYGVTPTTFRLPDLRGEFIRGADVGRGVDANRQVGTYQSSNAPKHFHGTGQYTYRGDDWLQTILRPWAGQTFKARYCSGDERWGVAPVMDISGSNEEYIAAATTDNIDQPGEIRPRNVALLPIIKF